MGRGGAMNIARLLRRRLLLAVLAAAATPADARITIDALGGELEVRGFLKSETRARLFAGSSHLGQWIQKLQVEAALNYNQVGFIEELTFVALARPEYDIVQDTGAFSSDRIGDGSNQPSLSGRLPFTTQNDQLAFGGFDNLFGAGATTTGGIGDIVAHGLQNPGWLQRNFEVDFARSSVANQRVIFGSNGLVNAVGGGFPAVVQKSSNLDLNCRRCVDLNLSNMKVATANTDSNGRLYPFRELYVDAVAGNWWVRLGKQQVVWGKTDFFRMQDVINPVDFGQHFFFDSFEDIRIPQWIASVRYKPGAIGPLTNNAFQLVWNFDKFQQAGLGNPSHFWALPFSKAMSSLAISNTFFSIEPCLGPGFMGTAGTSAADFCGSAGPLDDRLPSGFGSPAGLSANHRPGWQIENTEAGWRWEFRLSDFRFALSHWYGWNDVGALRFHTVNLSTAFLPLAPNGGGSLANDLVIGDLLCARQGCRSGGANAQAGNLLAAARAGTPIDFVFPIVSTSTIEATRLLEQFGTPSMQTAARNALNSGNFAPLMTGTDLAFVGDGSGCNPLAVNRGCLAFLGGQTSLEYKQSHTLGLSADYFEAWSGIVFRIESSWTFDELVTNTRAPDWLDTSDVMRFSIGLDRPTYIPLLSKDRTFFLSLQVFDTWYWDHEGDKNTGYLTDEHNWITTFFFVANYYRDTIKPVGFYVWEEASNSHVAGFNAEWLIDRNWSIRGGFHLIWEGDENTTHDAGAFTAFMTGGPDAFTRGTGANPSHYPYSTSVFGPARQGIGALRNYDEVFFELKYQF